MFTFKKKEKSLSSIVSDFTQVLVELVDLQERNKLKQQFNTELIQKITERNDTLASETAHANRIEAKIREIVG